MKYLCLAIFTFLNFSLLFATVINVPADYSTIQAGLNAAIEGDTVLVQPGTYYENIFWPDKNGIKLISAGDSSNTIIDGGENGSVIYINPQSANIDTSTLIKGFNITNGGNAAYGGGIYCNKASLKIENVLICNNTSSSKGGGIYFSESNTILINLIIRNNFASELGGGIYSDINSDVKLMDSFIISNIAESSGGGIFSSNIKLAGVKVSENFAKDGGGLSCSGSNTILENVNITNNTSKYGGGIQIYSSPHLENVFIYGNTATHSGGGLYICENSQPLIINSTISNNTASINGGGFYSEGNLHLGNLIIKENSAIYGGGLFISNGHIYRTSSISNTIIICNSSSNGGGIYLNGVFSNTYPILLSNNRIIENTSSKNGGGIFITSQSNPDIRNTAMINNYASAKGGGIYCTSSSYPNISQCLILKNKSLNPGRGIHTENSSSPVINSNNILENGFGLFNGDNSQFIQATGNWWGDSTGPHHPNQNPAGQGDSVNAFVNVTPWLTEPNIDAPPIPVQNLHINSTGNDFIELSWDPSPLGDLSGYKICYKTDATEFFYTDTIDVGNVTSYSLSGLSAGSAYYIAAICYDTDGNNSWYSKELVIELVSPPVWSSIPDTNFYEDSTLFISKEFFYPFVHDYDDPDSTLLFLFTDNEYVNVSLLNGTLQLNAIKDWNGIDTVSVIVTDGISNDTVQWVITVHPVNDPPYFTELMPDTISFYSNFKDTLELKGLASDIDSPDSSLKWFVEKSKIINWEIDSALKAIIFWIDDENISILDTVLFSVSDGHLKSYYSLIVIINQFTEISNSVSQIPQKYCLNQNYPNPFNPTTTISYQLPKSSFVKLIIYDISGRLVNKLIDEKKNAGYYTIEWNAENVCSGVYFYRIEAGNFVAVKKGLLVK